MLSVTNKPLMLNVIMQIVITLSVVMLWIIMLSVAMLSVVAPGEQSNSDPEFRGFIQAATGTGKNSASVHCRHTGKIQKGQE